MPINREQVSQPPSPAPSNSSFKERMNSLKRIVQPNTRPLPDIPGSSEYFLKVIGRQMLQVNSFRT